jgi:molybdenum cofactor biosynthesis protein B
VSDPVTQHRSHAPQGVSFAVVTVSDSRTIETDRGGDTIVELAVAAGHRIVARDILPDDPIPITDQIMRLVEADDVDAILMTGGTGISRRDQTYETVVKLLTRPLPGYGELFRYLSFQEIGAAAMLSRTLGGVVDETLLLTMPGSPAAVRLAMERLILPEIGHLLAEIGR